MSIEKLIMAVALCCLQCVALADEETYAVGESAAFDLNLREADLAWLDYATVHYGGSMTNDETWTAGSVHVVYGTLIVPEGVVLTIEPGAVVKFIGGGLYAVGTCIAKGVTFTDIADGMDCGNGVAALPMPSYVLKGDFETDDVTKMRFVKNGDEFASTGGSDTFRIDITDDEFRFAHDEEQIAFSSAWVNGSGVKVSVRKPNGCVETLVDESGMAKGVVPWAKPIDVGMYELRHESGGETLTAMFAIVDGMVHDGIVCENETWGRDKVHVVSRDVTVKEGATLTIEPGSVVKFIDGKSLTIEAGGVCVAEGVVFTSIHDDTVGGDSLNDGAATEPVANGYVIVGLVRDDLSTEYRYGVQSYSGMLAGEVTWRKERTYVIDGTLTVATNGVLAIPAGTVVKFTEGSAITVADGGVCVAEGAIFTHIADDAVGGDTMGDGDETKPTYGAYTVDVAVIDSDATEYRYPAPISTSGTISGNVVWRPRQVYRVTGNLTLASGATLNIAPGTVVKFDAGVSLTVNSGATLNAQGTRSLPIVFTSIKDDAHGGDTNGDGDMSFAKPGDWNRILVKGTVEMNYCDLYYGSKSGAGSVNDGDDDLISVAGGTASFSNGRMFHMAGYAVGLNSGNFFMTNSVISEAFCAFRHWPSDPIVNCVIYNCDRLSNNHGQKFYNCVIVGATEAWDWHSGGGNTYRNCVFWNESGFGLQGMPSSANAEDGNMWADPCLIDPDGGDFRVEKESPCVNAGDSALASAKDYWSKSRYGEADVGIYEVPIRPQPNDVDLLAVSISGEATATVGGKLKVSWTLENIGSAPADKTWHDAIELIDASGLTVELTPRAAAGPIKAHTRLTLTQSFDVPAVSPGSAKLRLRVNPNHEVNEGTQDKNNVAYSDATVDIRLPGIDEIAPGGRLSLGGGKSVSLQTVSGSVTALHIRSDRPVEAFAAAGYVPVALKNDSAAMPLADGSFLLLLPQSEKDAFVVFNNAGQDSASIEIEQVEESLRIFGVSPDRVPDESNAKIVLSGVGLGPSDVFELTGPTVIAVSFTEGISEGEIALTFDLTGITPGLYGIRATKEDGTSSVLDHAVEIFHPLKGAILEASIDIPSSLRLGRVYSGRIVFANRGDVDMTVPWFSLNGGGALMRVAGTEEWQTAPLELMGAVAPYPSGVLKPGAESFIDFEFQASSTPTFALTAESDLSEDWTRAKSRFADAATRLGKLGRVECRVSELDAAANADGSFVGGRLMDSISGEALDGATVSAYLLDGTALASDVVDANGVFVLDGIPPATNIVVCSSEGAFSETLLLAVPAEGDVAGVKIAGSRGKTLKVSLSGLDAVEMSKGVRLTATRLDGAQNDVIARATNTTVTLLVASDGIYSIAAESASGMVKNALLFADFDDSEVDGEIDFASGSTVSGVVVDESDIAVTNAVAMLSYADFASSGAFYAAVDASGTFMFKGIEDGRYRLKVSAGGCGGTAEKYVTVSGASIDVGTIAIARYSNTLRGTLANCPEGANVTLSFDEIGVSCSAEVSSDGRFEMDGLPQGAGTLVVFDGTGEAVCRISGVVVKPGENVIAESVDTSMVYVRCRAVDPDGETVFAKWTFMSEACDGKRVCSGEDGIAQAFLRTDDYTMIVQADGYVAETFSRRLDTSREISIVLVPGGKVSLAAESVSYAQFAIDGEICSGTLTGDGKTAETDSLAAGRKVAGFAVCADGAIQFAESESVAGETIVLEAEESTSFDIELADDSKIDHFLIENLDGPAFSGVFLPEGAHTTLKYPNRRVRVSAVSSDGTILKSVERGVDETCVSLSVSEPIPISGRVVCDWHEIPGGAITFMDGEMEVARVELASDGTFSVNLPPQDYDTVWVATSDGYVFDFSREDAVAAGWMLQMPDESEMGIVQAEVDDEYDNPVANQEVQFTTIKKFKLTRHTTNRGITHVFCKISDGNVTVQVPQAKPGVTPAGDEPGPTKVCPQPPNRCPDCGSFPCKCPQAESAAKVCPSCRHDPCLCGDRTKLTAKKQEPASAPTERELSSEELDSLIDYEYMQDLVEEEILPAGWRPWDYSWCRRYENRIASLLRRLDGLHKEPNPKYASCMMRGCDYNERVWQTYVRNSMMARNACYDASYMYENVKMDARRATGGVANDYLLTGLGAAGSNARAIFTAFASQLQSMFDGQTLTGGISAYAGALLPEAVGEMGVAYGAGALDRQSELVLRLMRDRQVMESSRSRLVDRMRQRIRASTRDRWRNSNWTSAIGNVIGVLQASGSISDRWNNINARMEELNTAVSFASRMVSLAAAAARRPYKECGVDEPDAGSTNVIACVTPSTPVPQDPNEVLGPEGVGPERRMIQGDTLEYTVFFENASTAETAPLDIYVDNPLDAALDWSTFRMVEIAFANQTDTGLNGQSGGECESKLNGTPYHVASRVALDETGVVRVELHLLDKSQKNRTPLDPYAGILQPNDATGRGEGHFTYRIKLRDDALPETVVSNAAIIVFDTNDPIETDPAWWNTVAKRTTLEEALDAESLEWTFGGAAEWTPEESPDGFGGYFARCGAVPNGTNEWLSTFVDGPGTLTFRWRSAVASRSTKYQLMIDGEVEGMLTGSDDWRDVSVVVSGDWKHEIRWRLMTGRSGANANDWVGLDHVVWTPIVPPTLAEALNTNLVWTTEGDALWRGVARASPTDSRDAWAVVTGLGDDGASFVQTRVYGSGVLSFDWAVSCEEDYDWMEFSVDGEVIKYISGDVGWGRTSVQIVGKGWHVVRWEYIKDELDAPELAGTNIAKLDNVTWDSLDVPPSVTQTTPVPVPHSELDGRFAAYLECAGGDYEAAANMTGRNGYAVWESYVAGLDPDDENSKFEAKIEIMSDGTVKVMWAPDSPELRKTREYTTYGKKTLSDGDWTPVTNADKDQYRFFKVEVRMK